MDCTGAVEFSSLTYPQHLEQYLAFNRPILEWMREQINDGMNEGHSFYFRLFSTTNNVEVNILIYMCLCGDLFISIWSECFPEWKISQRSMSILLWPPVSPFLCHPMVVFKNLSPSFYFDLYFSDNLRTWASFDIFVDYLNAITCEWVMQIFSGC